MEEIISLLHERAKAGKHSELVTVAASYGSAPRGMGAFMVVDGRGRAAGTIGGGMLEYKSIETAKTLLAQKMSGFDKYKLSKEETAELGMVCGGSVDVLYTYLPPDDNTKAVTERLNYYKLNNIDAYMLLPLSGGIGCFSLQDGALGAIDVPDFKAVEAIKMGIVNIDGKECYVQKLLQPMRVFIYGGGHLSQEIVPLLSRVGFECVVTDDRAEYSDSRLFPGVKEVRILPYNKLDGEFDITKDDCIIAVTQGHAGDYDVQKFALNTPAGYIGAVGSKTKIAFVNQKLTDDGFSEADIGRITAPIGLQIKSQTPAEIAVSIAAQLILHRAEHQ